MPPVENLTQRSSPRFSMAEARESLVVPNVYGLVHRRDVARPWPVAF